MKNLINRLQTSLSRTLYLFAFTKNDRRAIGLLSGLIALSLFLRAYGLVKPIKEWTMIQPPAAFRTQPTQTAIMENNTGSKSPKSKVKDSLPGKNNYTPPSYMIKKKFSVDLNQADTFDLQEIYGIGPTFAKRIVKYRNNLGGYISLRQLHEVWGIDSSLFRKIIPYLYIQDTGIRKININQADIRTLKQHPYLDYYQAKEIYLHRQKYGNFKRVAELKNVNLIDSGTYSRVSPYLSID